MDGSVFAMGGYVSGVFSRNALEKRKDRFCIDGDAHVCDSRKRSLGSEELVRRLRIRINQRPSTLVWTSPARNVDEPQETSSQISHPGPFLPTIESLSTLPETRNTLTSKRRGLLEISRSSRSVGTVSCYYWLVTLISVAR